MEILSDATFKGNATFNKNVTVDKFFQVGHNSSSTGTELAVGGNIFITDSVYAGSNIEASNSVYVGSSIRLGGTCISAWSDLNSILSFAPSSLSTTVSSNTSKINSACSTISSLCTKVNSLCTTVSSNTTKINSLCTTVSNIKQNTKHVFGNPQIPVGCTKFYFEENPMAGSKEYKFIVSDVNFAPSFTKVFKGGYGFVNEEVQMDVKQYGSGNMRWFEGTLSSNTTGYGPTEFILIFDEFKELCTTEKVPQ